MTNPVTSPELKAQSLRGGLLGISMFLDAALEETHASNPASTKIGIACGLVDMARSLATELLELMEQEEEKKRATAT